MTKKIKVRARKLTEKKENMRPSCRKERKRKYEKLAMYTYNIHSKHVHQTLCIYFLSYPGSNFMRRSWKKTRAKWHTLCRRGESTKAKAKNKNQEFSRVYKYSTRGIFHIFLYCTQCVLGSTFCRKLVELEQESCLIHLHTIAHVIRV